MPILAVFALVLSIFFGIRSRTPESRLSGRWSKYFLIIAIIVAALSMQGLNTADSPWIMDPYNGMLFSFVILGVLYFILDIKFSLGQASPLVSALGILLILSAMMSHRGVPNVWVTGHETQINLHAVFVFLSLSAFSLSFFFSCLFLAQDFFIRSKNIRGLSAHLPPLELTVRLNTVFIIVGSAALFSGILLGYVNFVNRFSAQSLLKEPSVLISIVVLSMYLAILAFKSTAAERGRRLAFMSISMYLLLLFAYYGVYRFGGMHG